MKRVAVGGRVGAITHARARIFVLLPLSQREIVELKSHLTR